MVLNSSLPDLRYNIAINTVSIDSRIGSQWLVGVGKSWSKNATLNIMHANVNGVLYSGFSSCLMRWSIYAVIPNAAVYNKYAIEVVLWSR